MKVAIIHNAVFPVALYGGTERAVWWLAKGLSELGITVTLVAAPGSECPFAKILAHDFSKPFEPARCEFDLLHFFHSPRTTPHFPYVVTVEGNGREGEEFAPNTIFVSRDHAERHGAKAFVYNGIDPDEYRFEKSRSDYLVFLAKASWRVKNVKGAIRMARAAKVPLHILGGRGFILQQFRGVSWHGMVGGARKALLLAKSRGLFFPVEWNEPFGIAVIEALVSGAPVYGSRKGSLPELVPTNVGFLSNHESELIRAIKSTEAFSPRECRDYAIANFHYRTMAKQYLSCYEAVLAGNLLNPQTPKSQGNPGELSRLKR